MSHSKTKWNQINSQIQTKLKYLAYTHDLPKMAILQCMFIRLQIPKTHLYTVYTYLEVEKMMKTENYTEH